MKLSKIVLLIVLFLVLLIGSVQIYNCKNVCTTYGITFLQPTNYSLVKEGSQPIHILNGNGQGLVENQYILLKDNMPFKVTCLEEYRR